MSYVISYPFGVDLPASPLKSPLPRYKSMRQQKKLERQSQELSPLQSPNLLHKEFSLPRSDSNRILSNSSQSTLSALHTNDSELQDANLIKAVLDENYKQQIAEKVQQQRMKKRQRIMEQRDLLSQLQIHGKMENQLTKKIRSQYMGQLQQEIKLKKLQSELLKTEQNELEKSKGVRKGGLVHKSESFKRFYDKAFEYRENVAAQYLKYMKKEEDYAHSRNSMKVFNPEKHFSLQKQQDQIEAKARRQQKQYLRTSLQRQILDQNRLKIDINKDKKGDYSNNKQLYNIYNPFLSPIDPKINRNNQQKLNQAHQRKDCSNPQ